MQKRVLRFYRTIDSPANPRGLRRECSQVTKMQNPEVVRCELHRSFDVKIPPGNPPRCPPPQIGKRFASFNLQLSFFIKF